MTSFKEENKIDEALKQMRDDNSGYTWVTIGYTADFKALELKGTGQGDVDEIKQTFIEDGCFYSVYRVTEKIDESITVKFALIKFMGDKIKPMQRGKIFSQTGAIQKN